MFYSKLHLPGKSPRPLYQSIRQKSHAYYYSKECNEERERRRGARKERIYHAKIARRAACSGTGNGNVGANFDLQLCFNQLVVPPPRGHDTKWKRQREGDAGTPPPPQFNRLPPAHLRELEAVNWAAAAASAARRHLESTRSVGGKGSLVELLASAFRMVHTWDAQKMCKCACASNAFFPTIFEFM